MSITFAFLVSLFKLEKHYYLYECLKDFLPRDHLGFVCFHNDLGFNSHIL